MENTNFFPINLKRLIDESSFRSNAEFARACEFGETYLSYLLSGKREPSLENLRKMAAVLKVRLGDLLDEPPKEKSLSEMSQSELFGTVERLLITIEKYAGKKEKRPMRPATKLSSKEQKKRELFALIDSVPSELIDSLVNTLRGVVQSTLDQSKLGNIKRP